MNKVKIKITPTFVVLLSIYIAIYLVANMVAGVKLVDVFGFVLAGGFLSYALTFPITDIVCEVYGHKPARMFVVAGLAGNIAMILFILATYMLPPLTPDMQSLYSRAFMPAIRVVLASITAYIVAQITDIELFMKIKKKTGGKYLWLRNNTAEAIAQFLDSIIFTMLAFYGIIPLVILINMVFAQWMWKVIVNLLDTPFVYIGVKIVRFLEKI